VIGLDEAREPHSSGALAGSKGGEDLSECLKCSNCKACEHGVRSCDVTGCWDCREAYIKAMVQYQREEALKRKKANPKPWQVKP
jgi:hypothetical protein